MSTRANRMRARRRKGNDGANWLSFSDLMSAILLIFILIMFYIMYQYFDMYETSAAEIARQQYDLDQANATLEEKSAKLTEAESRMVLQQVRLDAAQKDLEDAQAVLETQQSELDDARTLLGEKETEIATRQADLDAAQKLLGEKETEISDKQAQIDSQQQRLDLQQTLLTGQQTKLNEQQKQIEQLVGLKTRIISELSSALKRASISAQVDPDTGAIVLESDVMFEYGLDELTERGKQFIDRFLPVYLDVLFSDEYLPSLAEIIVEGHTDKTGDYIYNLGLSQRRALSVASYVLSDEYTGISPAQKQVLRDKITANGRSYSHPVLRADGSVDQDASRRVLFLFRLTDEQMIEQLKNILESDS